MHAVSVGCLTLHLIASASWVGCGVCFLVASHSAIAFVILSSLSSSSFLAFSAGETLCGILIKYQATDLTQNWRAEVIAMGTSRGEDLQEVEAT